MRSYLTMCSMYMMYMMLTVVFINNSQAMISNNTCAPIPRDRRQQICHCTKHLQLRCSFSSDINRMETKDLDSSLRPIFYDNVTLERLVDFDDYGDMNANFELNKKRYKNNQKIFYLYFPDFKIFNSPFIRLTLRQFVYIPSFAFTEELSPKIIETIVFELPEVYDFGVDKHAFFNLKVTDILVIEGPFNQITFHKEAFTSSAINELIIGCYCIECESFEGKCRIRFGQESKYPSEQNNIANETNSFIKSIKLFGIEFDWDFDIFPNADTLQNLEISNSRFHQNPDFNKKINRIFQNLQQFIFKNNNLQNLDQLNYLNNFPKLKILNLNSNEIDVLDQNSFHNLKFLLEISIENNNLVKLDSETFGSNLAALKILKLGQNRIEEIQNGAFKNLENLIILDLSYNKLQSIQKDTLLGLTNLKELYLSYNPFKIFDLNAFMHTLNLKRLSIISQAEKDWFNFENEDVCLLSYFKCDTQINIDPDQRCNCFVKYVNLIGSSADNDATKWYKSCLFEEKENLNRYLEETNKYFAEINNLELNEKDPNTVVKPLYDSSIKCSENLVKNCFKNQKINYINNSCLYRKIVLPELTKLNPKQQVMEKFTTKQDDVLTGQVTSSELSKPRELISELFQQAVQKEIVREAIEKKENKKFCGSLADDDCIMVILVFLGAVFFISIISLIIGIYLFCNRSKYVYHAANSGYPQDE